MIGNPTDEVGGLFISNLQSARQRNSPLLGRFTVWKIEPVPEIA